MQDEEVAGKGLRWETFHCSAKQEERNIPYQHSAKAKQNFGGNVKKKKLIKIIKFNV